MSKTPPETLEGVPRPGEVVLDKYRIDRIVGVGGMGVVMEARFVQLDERVAIKFLLPSLGANAEAAARFEREAKALFKVKSEHVCRVHELATLPNGLPFIVMEYLEGHDLATELAPRKGLPIERAVGYVLQACHGLGEAHARGIVHRDLKPENFFVSEIHGEPCLKVLDFGLSKLDPRLSQGRRERKLTGSAQAMGTPRYMAPEQWISSTSVAAAADQWGLGIILYELLTGAPPFAAEDVPQICALTLNAPTPSLQERRRDAPAGLEAAVRKCLEKQPGDRHEHVGALAVALAPFGPPGALEAAERLSAMLDRASDGASVSLMLAPAPKPSEPRMPTDDSWQHVLANVAAGNRSSLLLWTTIAVGCAAVVLLLVMMLQSDAPPPSVPAQADPVASATPPPPPPPADPTDLVVEPPPKPSSKPPVHSVAPTPPPEPSVAPSAAPKRSIFEDR